MSPGFGSHRLTNSEVPGEAMNLTPFGLTINKSAKFFLFDWLYLQFTLPVVYRHVGNNPGLRVPKFLLS